MTRSPELQAAHDRFDAWVRDVRDPASVNPEPPVTARDEKGAWVSYTLSPIPLGWAWKASCGRADGTGGSTPWRGPVATREAAMDTAIAHCNREPERVHALSHPELTWPRIEPALF